MAAEAIEIAGDRAGRRAEAAAAEAEVEVEVEVEAEYRREVGELVDLLSNLNPSAEEFVPSSRSSYGGGGGGGGRRTRSGAALSAEAPVFVAPHDDNAAMNAWLQRDQKRKNSYSERKRRSSASSSQKDEREDSIKRTVYISEIDQHITEEQLAALFSTCGKVIDCRICGDANSTLRFAFVEFASESKSAYGVRLSHEKADLRASLAQLQLQINL